MSLFVILYCVYTCISCNSMNLRIFFIEECMNGSYGETCEKKCPGCYQGDCDRNTGECTQHKCLPNYYGHFCNTTCVEKCLTCDEKSGSCIQCDANLAGSKCDKVCGECLNNKCINGTCTDGCMNGYFGELCSEKCNSTCKSHICNFKSGICTNGCQPGWEGVFCEG
jgi:hypothetical protein